MRRNPNDRESDPPNFSDVIFGSPKAFFLYIARRLRKRNSNSAGVFDGTDAINREITIQPIKNAAFISARKRERSDELLVEEIRRLRQSVNRLTALSLISLAILAYPIVEVSYSIAREFFLNRFPTSHPQVTVAPIQEHQPPQLVQGGVFHRIISRTGVRYFALEVDLNVRTLRIFHSDQDGIAFGSMASLGDRLTRQNQRIVFAMNAGMFRKNLRPVGLHIEDGHLLQKLNLKKVGASPHDNFFKLPNAVFLVEEGRAIIVDSSLLAERANWSGVSLATQSGPALILNGQIHSSFDPASKNLEIRNGVGVMDSGKVVFAISRDPVSFYDFATFFKETFDTDNALYLDGVVSRFFLPEASETRLDNSTLGSILAITE